MKKGTRNRVPFFVDNNKSASNTRDFLKKRLNGRARVCHILLKKHTLLSTYQQGESNV